MSENLNFRTDSHRFGSKLPSWLIVGVVFATLATACGSDVEESAPATTAAPAATTAAPAATTAAPAATTAAPATTGDSTGVTDDEIKLGTFGDVSGPVAVVGLPFRTAHDIVAAKVNEAGGINGRQIVLVHEDDQYDPARTIGAVRKMLEQDEVFLIFDSIGTPQCAAVMETLREENVPVIQCGVATRDENVTWSWQTVPTNNTVGLSMASYVIANLPAVSTIAIVAQEGEVGQPFIDGVKEAIEGTRIELVEIGSFKPTDMDLSSQVARLQATNPDLVLVNGNPRSASLFYNEAQQQGFKPPQGFFADIAQNDSVIFTLVDPEFLEGTLVAGYIENLASDSPAMEQFKADVEKYAPGEEPSAFMLLAYADALVTMEVLRLAGDNPTREGVLDVLANEMEGYDANGLLVPLKWSGDQHVGVQGISLDLITDGAFVRVNEYFELEE